MRRCPDCGAGLAPTYAENVLAGILGDVPVEVDVCGKCGGAYFDRDEFGYVTGDMSLARVARPVDADAASPCPGCAGAMEARHAHGLQFSACVKCGGMWFAGREIDRLL